MSGKATKERADKLLLARGLAETRARAQALVMSGAVFSGERRIDKPGTLLPVDCALTLKGDFMPFVSRGGLKLQAALDRFQITVEGKIALDIGASTGGFTDCLLQRGAMRVYAVDVGYGQLHEKLRADPRVISHERINARDLSAHVVKEPVAIVVVDVSFISLERVLPAGLAFLKPGGVLVALVKPQFEVGKGQVGKGGVVRDAGVRQNAIDRIVAFAEQMCRLQILGVMDSPIAGPAGNLEALMVAVKDPRA